MEERLEAAQPAHQVPAKVTTPGGRPWQRPWPMWHWVSAATVSQPESGTTRSRSRPDLCCTRRELEHNGLRKRSCRRHVRIWLVLVTHYQWTFRDHCGAVQAEMNALGCGVGPSGEKLGMVICGNTQGCLSASFNLFTPSSSGSRKWLLPCFTGGGLWPADYAAAVATGVSIQVCLVLW